MYDKEEIKKKLAEIAPEFDIDEEEAKKKYDKYKSHDPFPEIAPALLNTADILAYVKETGMIHPFHPEMAFLKPASYAIPLRGKCIYFDEHGQKHQKIINEIGDKFPLLHNSIAFVTLEPYFRIPDYIALRFNLKIDNIYKGLLIGTGPLVDPGFEGRLSFPLHNLTTNDYEFEAGEQIVFFEFTKLSLNKIWEKKDNEILERTDIYIPFPEEKKGKDVEYYVANAAQNKPVRSSIPEAIHEGKEAAKSVKKALEEAQKLKNIAYLSLAGLLLAIIIGVGAIIIQGVSLVRDTKNSIWEVQRDMSSFQKEFNIEIENLNDKISLLEGKIDSLATQNNEKIKNSTERDER